MKKLEVILRPQKLSETIKALEQVGITGFTVTQAVGRGRQKTLHGTYRGHRYAVNLHPKVKLEIVMSDYLVPRTIEAILSAARTGEDGDGKIFVFPVEDAFNIRTGQYDDSIDELAEREERM